MNKPLKILQVIDSLSVGGAEMMAVNIANGLINKNDVESYLCSTRAEGQLKEKINREVGYVFLNRKKSIDVKTVIKLYKYIKECKIDIIHAHSSSFFICVFIKLMKSDLKIIWHDHYGKAEKINERKSSMLKICSNLFSSIISVNTILENWAKKELYCKNVDFIANFASLSNSKKITCLKGSNGKRIVCVAAFRPQKDHINLLKAFVLIQKKYPDWTLHLIGKKHEDDYGQLVGDFIKKENLKDKVFLYDSCLDIKYILDQSNIGVLSSNSEGLPVSLLEYGLAGLPVVVTDVGECKRVVNNYGLVVSKEDEVLLFKGIQKYIEDEKLSKLYARQFQNHIFENYDQKVYFSKLLNTYYKC